jgi:hypothetical protein
MLPFKKRRHGMINKTCLLALLILGMFFHPIDKCLSEDSLKWVPQDEPELNCTIRDIENNESPRRSYKFIGWLLGTAGGIATGFLIAHLTDYALEEGGAYSAILGGGGIGGYVGYRIGASVGRKFTKEAPHTEDAVSFPGKFKTSFGYAWTRSMAREDIREAFQSSGFNPTNPHHAIAPNLSLSYRINNRFNPGLELSGISAQEFESCDDEVHLSANLTGNSYSVIMDFTPYPLDNSSFDYAFGFGLDYYSVNVENYFDLRAGNYTENEFSRFIHTTINKFGLLLRASLDYYIVKDVSIQFRLSGRLVKPIEIQEISITHPITNDHWRLIHHSVNLSAFYLSTGIGMHF